MNPLPSLAQGALQAPTSLLDPRLAVALLGVLLLGWGARLYRLAIAAPGFTVGVFAGLSVSAGAGLAVQAGVALALGLLGGGLMLALERLAVAITGAVLVGGLVFAVGPLVSATLPWFAPVVGGAVGLLLFPRLYRAALRLLTPLLGALCVAWAAGRPHDLLLIGGLTLVGAVFQLARAGKRDNDEREQD